MLRSSSHVCGGSRCSVPPTLSGGLQIPLFLKQHRIRGYYRQGYQQLHWSFQLNKDSDVHSNIRFRSSTLLNPQVAAVPLFSRVPAEKAQVWARCGCIPGSHSRRSAVDSSKTSSLFGRRQTEGASVIYQLPKYVSNIQIHSRLVLEGHKHSRIQRQPIALMENYLDLCCDRIPLSTLSRPPGVLAPILKDH